MAIERSSIIPYSVQISEAIKKRIIRERLSLNHQLPSVKELAEEFSVSIETVRTALRELASQGIVAIERGRGTFVTKDYLTLMREEEVPELVRQNIGVLMQPFPKGEKEFGPEEWQEYIKSWWGGCIFAGIQSQAGGIGRFLTVIPRNTSEVKESIELVEYSRNQVGGFIIFPLSAREDDRRALLEYLEGLELPWVTINQMTHEQEDNFVTVDYYGGGRRVAEYLVGGGHHSFLLLGDYRDRSVSGADRFNGFISVLKERGLREGNFEIRYAEGQGNWYGRDATRRFLKERGRPDAIFAAGDYLAIGAMEAATEAGFKVPADISVVGATGLEVAEYSTPRLTTLASPMYTMGVQSVNFLIESIRRREIKRKGITLEPKLLIRESTR